MSVAAHKSDARFHGQTFTEAVIEEEVLMAGADMLRREGRKNLYVTSGALFAGLVGVFCFAAPGGVIGGIAGALVGLLLAQRSPA